MTTYRELVYMVKDSLKINSDDSYIENGHIVFQLNSARTLLLNQKYTGKKFLVPEENFLELCLDLEYKDRIKGLPCEGYGYMRTKLKPPHILGIAKPRIFSLELFGEDIPLIPIKRMMSLGYNRFTDNIIYASYGTDGHIYLFSQNPEFYNLKQIRMSAVFSDPSKVQDMLCEGNSEYQDCGDILDLNFPIESSLVYQLVEVVVKYFSIPQSIIPDVQNNAQDDGPIFNKQTRQSDAQ